METITPCGGKIDLYYAEDRDKSRVFGPRFGKAGKDEVEAYAEEHGLYFVADVYEWQECELLETYGHVWHVGSNRLGYPPEGDVDCFEDLRDALRGLIENLGRSAEAMECQAIDEDGHACGECEDCQGCAQVEEAVKDLEERLQDEHPDPDDLPEYIIDDGRAIDLRFWVDQVSWNDCDHENDEQG